jgi:hypothetical protein
MHKPDARLHADTKSCLGPNYFVVGITSVKSREYGFQWLRNAGCHSDQEKNGSFLLKIKAF